MKKENTEQIRQYILKQIDTREKDYARKTVENFQISKSSVYSYTKKMCDEHILQRAEGKMPPYRLETQEHTFHYENNGTLGEDRIFSKDIEPLLHDCPKNVLSAWRYAFTEMMNNAIEHSHASKILVIVQTFLPFLVTGFLIVFKKVLSVFVIPISLIKSQNIF